MKCGMIGLKKSSVAVSLDSITGAHFMFFLSPWIRRTVGLSALYFLMMLILACPNSAFADSAVSQYRCGSGLCVNNFGPYCPADPNIASVAQFRQCSEKQYYDHLGFFGKLTLQHVEMDSGGSVTIWWSSEGNGAYTTGLGPVSTGQNTPSVERNLGGGACPGCGGTMFGNPINVATGNKFQSEQDYAINGVFPIEFTRSYNSGSSVNGVVGSHWSSSYSRSLVWQSLTQVKMYRDDGAVKYFNKCGNAWCPTADDVGTLTQNNDSNGYAVSWDYRDANLVAEKYDAAGRFLSETNRGGLTHQVSYDTSGRISGVTDSFGRSAAFAYGADGRLAQLTEADGSVIGYVYDTAGNLSSVTYPGNNVRKYFYDEAGLVATTGLGLLTGIEDEQGNRYATFKYDSSARAFYSTHGEGEGAIQVSYGTDGTSTVQDALLSSRTYTLQSIQSVYHLKSVQGEACATCARDKSYTFDSAGNLAGRVDFNGNTTTSSYNASHLEESRIEAVAQPEQRTTNTTWDVALRVPLSRALLDASGNQVAKSAWIYNSRGQVLASCETDPGVTAAASYTCAVAGAMPEGVRRWRYTYCDNVDSTQCPVVGLLLSITAPRTDIISTTLYSYYLSTDESGCGSIGGACHRAGDLYQVTDAVGHVRTMVAYDKNGHLVRERDANGVFTDSAYNARGWLLTRTIRANADGTQSPSDAVTQIGYTPYGSVASVNDPDGIQVAYTYDTAHRLTDVTDALGNRIHYTLDAAGNKAKEETFDAGNVLRRSLARSYNTLGRLTGLKDGLNRMTLDAGFTDSYDASGNLVRSADALGIQRKHSYDALDRLVSTIDNYNGTDTATQNTQSVFTYGPRDELQGVSDPDSLNTTYDYDGLGNATGLHSPDTGTSTYVYDAAGNRIQATDARGVVSHSTYDALNRITATTYPSSSANVSYHYDEADGVTGCAGSHPAGRLTSMVETAVTTVYCYDIRGNVVQKRQTQGTNVDTVSYTYTVADRLASTRTPDGTLIQYGRDGLGRINLVTAQLPGAGSAGNVVTNVSYLPFGPIAGYTLGNGQTITRSYDANYAVTDVVSPVLNLHFARDAMGNITALGNVVDANPAIETYSYDPLYRLTGLKDAQGQPVEAYTYNKTGDRLSKTSNGLATGTYGYQTGTHWLMSIGSSARTYDAHGNTTGNATGGDTFGYGYNDRNRMAVVQRNGQTVGSYTYNAMGQRVAKAAAANQRFAYDEGSQLIGEYGTASRSYVWLDSLPVAVIDTSGATSTMNYVHADGLGTPRTVTDGAGTTIWQWSYQANPFGEKAPAAAGLTLNVRFPGQYYDAELALSYNVNRNYEAATGRYIQSDPIGLGGGANTYTYGGGSPTSNSDALGLYCRSWGGSTYCAYPGGPSFMVPTPNGFEDFGSGDDYYHAYDVTRPLGDADPDCVMQQLINNSVPNNPNGGVRPATPEGTPNIAYIPIIGTDNHVTSYLAKNLSGPGMVAVNMTGSGSTFSPGYVARTVSDGVAHTYGEGTSPIQSSLGLDNLSGNPLGALNNIINERVWGRQMEEFISKAKKRCGCGH
ncbi:DUF6531 domain-containing protein [Dyella sp. LX-1]|uniref:DUF6531 domain-containing protein n=1 Tax=unclassified Dyella TaxID=2634549 RepID=UPI0031F2F5ED